MALRRAKRSIEVFDIALMAVVTKAMGAFLVLMLLMLPSYNNLPAMQDSVAAAEAQRQQLAANVDALKRRNAELKTMHAEEASLEDRRKALEEENGRLRQTVSTSLILTFSWADCDADRFDFYARGENVQLANGSVWPTVRAGEQNAPLGVVQYGSSSSFESSDPNATGSSFKVGTLFYGMLGVYLTTTRKEIEDIVDSLDKRARKQMLWAISNVRPGARFAVYAKLGNLRAACRPHIGTFATDVAARDDTGAPHWNNWTLTPDQSGRIIHLGHVVWTGKELQLSDASAADQAALGEQTNTR